MTLKTYEATETRFIGGQYRKAGEAVQMSEKAAKYYTAPHGTGLKLAEEALVPAEDQAVPEDETAAPKTAPEPAPKPAPKSTKTARKSS